MCSSGWLRSCGSKGPHGPPATFQSRADGRRTIKIASSQYIAVFSRARNVSEAERQFRSHRSLGSGWGPYLRSKSSRQCLARTGDHL